MVLSNRLIAALAALNGLIAVLLGALGTHGVADAHARELIRTGSIYELVHAAAALAVLGRSRWSALLMSVGALLFGGSIYLLAFAGLPAGAALAQALPVLGPITPLGGVLMIAGWACLLVTVCLRPASPPPEGP
jgi:uncharacterized membrane protein YgdD (TMEM256/DUF423 family)